MPEEDKPIFNPSYQKYRNYKLQDESIINNNMELNEEEIERIENEEQNQLPMFFRVMRIVGSYLFMSMMKNYGNLYQIMVVTMVILVYLFI